MSFFLLFTVIPVHAEDMDTAELDELSVTATKVPRKTIEVSASVDVITKEDIEQTKAWNVGEAIGSLPGVVVGALILVGLPELLREFKEYRLLMYGALLIGMMLYKPEGFWPSAIRKRELHAGEEGLHVDQELPHAPLTRE